MKCWGCRRFVEYEAQNCIKCGMDACPVWWRTGSHVPAEGLADATEVDRRLMQRAARYNYWVEFSWYEMEALWCESIED